MNEFFKELEQLVIKHGYDNVIQIDARSIANYLHQSLNNLSEVVVRKQSNYKRHKEQPQEARQIQKSSTEDRQNFFNQSLKDKLSSFLKSPEYRFNDYTKIVKAMLNYPKWSEKQCVVLARHLVYGSDEYEGSNKEEREEIIQGFLQGE